MQLYKLFKGSEPEDKIRLLAKAANLQSADKIDALVAYFCNGDSQRLCEQIYGIRQQTISSAVTELNKHYELACKIVYSERSN